MTAQAKPIDRRQLIVDTARKLFATRPYDQVTTARVAKDAGVAYGLIAHHFVNKRGLYLAVMNEIAAEIAAAQTAPVPPGTPLADQLRHALRSHITHIDSYSDSFVALLRGALGADAEHQSAVEHLRWLGAQRILSALEVVEPIAPTLRIAMHGWIGFLDEMMIDRITHRDVDVDILVELAATALATTLRTAAALDASVAYSPEAVEALESIGAGPN
ncbi:TetR/AcrR family transcriptional regulator [Mycolicibacterium boenickei]|uniref:TetR family transcriptional regulator n=1 Tax=Mycolicibacterium boenickei TaxID=146017 RepID=A0AAX3A3I8_9MYCO|nr:TetR/AcrR family transcriptional regulator [Mycolicibacterium boenickei]PEG58139.1 TetR/AcrR family transcriptional regulator [Mycolicibacterium boenickei]UNC01978.1 TetR/AcrR family transcriptional regulator [Mycolicibacterium boenickei]BBX91921.1 TetR family transcriptional regulator [Mycolicibacterium boenickei]